MCQNAKEQKERAESIKKVIYRSTFLIKKSKIAAQRYRTIGVQHNNSGRKAQIHTKLESKRR